MGVVSWLHMMNLQLQWEWSFDYTCLICNCNGSAQLVTPSEFTTTRGVVSRWRLPNLHLQWEWSVGDTFPINNCLQWEWSVGDTWSIYNYNVTWNPRKCLKIPKGYTEAVNRKRQTIIDQKKKDKMTYNFLNQIKSNQKFYLKSVHLQTVHV